MIKKCLLSFLLFATTPLLAMEDSFKEYQVAWLKNHDIPDTLVDPLNPYSTEEGKPYHIIVICGTKGAGKTTTINKLQTKLEGLGHYVELHAPFAEANRIFAQQNGSFGMFTHSSGTAIEADNTLHNIVESAVLGFIKNLHSADQGSGVLLFDRGWLTALASLDDAHESLTFKQRQRLWKHHWLEHVYPTVFVEAEPEITKARRQGQLDLKSGLPTEESVVRDYYRRKNLLIQFKDWVIKHFDTSLLKGDDIGTYIEKESLEIAHKISKSLIDFKENSEDF
jgi:thymidylate kinase